MAKTHGKNTYLSISAVDISNQCSNVSLNRTQNNADKTAFGDSWETANAGQRSGTFSFDVFEDASIIAALEALAGDEAIAVVYGPEGNGVGKIKQSFLAVLESYNSSGSTTDNNKASVTLKLNSNNGITYGVF